MSYSSQLLQEAIEALGRLPGVGKKSALRMALFLIKGEKHELKSSFIEPIQRLLDGINFCSECNNLSDESICTICQQSNTRESVICVVESIRDVMAIEDTGQYKGMYHVLGGVISPLDGISADDLSIDQLINRVKAQNIHELIMGISPSIEGETTIYYISRKLQDYPIRISQLARGISFGGDLEYADELTLGRSIVTRTPYIMNNLHR